MVISTNNLKIVDLKSQIQKEHFISHVDKILFEDKYELSDNYVLEDCLHDLAKITVYPNEVAHQDKKILPKPIKEGVPMKQAQDLPADLKLKNH